MRRPNIDELTNIGWMVLAAIAVFEKITHQEIPQDAKTTILEIAAGVSLYFNGKPSHVTEKLLKKVAGYDLADADSDRGSRGAGADYPPAHGLGAWDGAAGGRESGLNYGASDSRLVGNRPSDRATTASISPPESIEPNSDRAKAAAWYAADVARGRAMPPNEFSEWSQSAQEDESGPQSEAW